MTTYEMIRCKKCSMLIEDENGIMICLAVNKPIEKITDEECKDEMEMEVE